MLASVFAAATVLTVGPARAQVYDFSFTGSGIAASGTLDVSGGYATSGTGMVTMSAPALASSETETLTLVTLSTPLLHALSGMGYCSPDSPTCLSYRFGGGTDLIGDTDFSASAPCADDKGPVFIVGGPYDIGFNFWSDGGSAYTGFLAGKRRFRAAPFFMTGSRAR